MIKSTWHRPTNNDQQSGINACIIEYIRKNDIDGVFGNSAFVKTDVIIHGYRENGASLEVVVESHWKIDGLPTIIKFKNVVL